MGLCKLIGLSVVIRQSVKSGRLMRVLKSALAHQDHLHELQGIIFKKFGIPHPLVIYGDPSPELLENAKAGGMDVKIFTLLQGL